MLLRQPLWAACSTLWLSPSWRTCCNRVGLFNYHFTILIQSLRTDGMIECFPRYLAPVCCYCCYSDVASAKKMLATKNSKESKQPRFDVITTAHRCKQYLQHQEESKLGGAGNILWRICWGFRKHSNHSTWQAEHTYIHTYIHHSRTKANKCYNFMCMYVCMYVSFICLTCLSHLDVGQCSRDSVRDVCLLDSLVRKQKVSSGGKTMTCTIRVVISFPPSPMIFT